MGAPIKSNEEITVILNKGNNAVADLGYEIVGDAKRGLQLDNLDFRDKVYRLILLRGYLKNLVKPEDGDWKNYYLASENEKKFNVLLDAVNQLSKGYGGPGIPLIRGKRIPLLVYQTNPGNSSVPTSTGGPATPGGVTFQNPDIDAPGEIVDSIDAASMDYAFYVIRVTGSGPGEGSRLDIIGVNWSGSNTPVITEYRGADVGGSTAGVSFSAALNGSNIELTCNVPTDNWSVKGNRISFENISFQNALAPLPIGGTLNQVLKKLSSANYDVGWGDIAISDITGLATQLVNLTNALNNYLLLAGGVMSGNIAMGNNKVTGLAAASSNGEAVRYEQLQSVISSLGAYLLLSGGTMSGAINMGNQKITNLLAGAASGEAVAFQQLANYLLLSGGTMTGALNMGSHKITGITPGGAAGEAATWDQLELYTIVNIGDWNMGASASVNVLHGLTLSKIRSITGVLRNDSDSVYYPIPYVHPNSRTGAGNQDSLSIIAITSTYVQIVRTDTGWFTLGGFTATGYNRGYLFIKYIP